MKKLIIIFLASFTLVLASLFTMHHALNVLDEALELDID